MPTINRKTNKIENVEWGSNQSAPFYNSKGWKVLRNNYIRLHPLCEECLYKGISTPAEQVHHKKEFLSGKTDDERWSLLLNPNNLMSVCRKCHSEIHSSR